MKLYLWYEVINWQRAIAVQKKNRMDRMGQTQNSVDRHVFRFNLALDLMDVPAAFVLTDIQ